jgi:hypothetical protein
MSLSVYSWFSGLKIFVINSSTSDFSAPFTTAVSYPNNSPPNVATSVRAIIYTGFPLLKAVTGDLGEVSINVIVLLY